MALDNPLWRYALSLYARPGVEAAALELQRHGCSINRLLFACWLAGEGLELQPGMLAGEALEWQRTLTHPLRALRYRVRERKAAQSELDNCYRRLREAELAAEQVELMLLWLQAEDACGSPPGLELAWRNLRCATAAAEQPWERLQPLLFPLIAAAFP